MQYGSRERFDYGECAECGTLQIKVVPEDLARHYRHDRYASWRDVPAYVDKPLGSAGRWLRAARARHQIDGSGSVGALVKYALGAPEMPDTGVWAWLRAAGADPGSRIYDFGCGPGELLRYLRLTGFRRLVGYDMFSGCDMNLPGLRLGGTMPGPEERFDLVMAHHSLEHIADPSAALQLLRGLLAPGGTLLVRIPVSQTYAWRTYGADWIQLDAPRHLFVPSLRGMDQLVAHAGLRLQRRYFDSSNFQFLGSEQYRREIPMFGDTRSYFDGNVGQFSRGQAHAWQKQAEQLNAADDGDQACFFLQAAA